jgi:putative oxidoreductase
MGTQNSHIKSLFINNFRYLLVNSYLDFLLSFTCLSTLYVLFIMANRLNRSDWGLFFLRLGIGFSFAFIHGLPKLLGGVPKWEKLGHNMSHLHITWMPVFWGFMAMFAEFFGGLFLILGIFVRPAAVLMLFTMSIAIFAHLSDGDSYKDMVEIFEISGGLLCLLIMGGGSISLKGLLRR